MEDEEELSANDNVEMRQQGARCSVTVVCPEGEDSGMYTCLAYNDSGHTSCQAQLTVEEGEVSAPSSAVLNLKLWSCGVEGVEGRKRGRIRGGRGETERAI